MTSLYKYINSLALIIGFYSTCLGMEQTFSLMNMPPDIHQTIYQSLILKSQKCSQTLKYVDRLRGTCSYWRQIGDELTANSGLLKLLRTLHGADDKTKTRILFYSIYNNDYALTKHILEITPNTHLYLGKKGDRKFNPYHLAQNNNNENIIKLLQEYGYNQKNNGFDQFNQIIPFAPWPKIPIINELFIACITGDNISLKEIINIKFKQKDIVDTIIEQDEGKPTFNREASYIIEFCAFPLIIHNDDDRCILSCIQFIKDNPECDYFLDEMIKNAALENSIKVFKELLKAKDNINKITLKTNVLERYLQCYKSKEQYDQIKNILNEYDAKTIKELAEENQSIPIWHTLFDNIKSHYFIKLFFTTNISYSRFTKILLQHIIFSLTSYMKHLLYIIFINFPPIKN